ncbi:hypothetical protein CVT24_010887, partial [Panaeolus cyanescens]
LIGRYTPDPEEDEISNLLANLSLDEEVEYYSPEESSESEVDLDEEIPPRPSKRSLQAGLEPGLEKELSYRRNKSVTSRTSNQTRTEEMPSDAGGTGTGGQSQGGSRSRFPSPRDNNAPRFDKDEPVELTQFITEMEELFTEFGITDARDKMKKIVRYTDRETEDQWKALPAYGTGDWEKFKKELIKSYPKAREVEKGSLRRLDEAARKYKNLTTHHSDEVHELVRVFRGEVRKLEERQAVGKGITSQRELVEMFFRALSRDFVERIKSSIDNDLTTAHYAEVALAKYNKTDLPEEPEWTNEERYTIARVIKHAQKLTDAVPSNNVDNSNLNLNVSGYSSGGASIKSEEISELKAYLHKLEELHKQSEQRQMERIERLTQETRAQFQSITQAQNGAQVSNARPYVPASNTFNGPRFGNTNFNSNNFNNNKKRGGPTNEKEVGACFYCQRADHFFQECPFRLGDRDTGRIVVVNGRTCLPDGSTIPRFPEDKTMKEKVDEWHKNREANFLEIDESGQYVAIVAPPEPPKMSIYTNKVRDQRDEVIERYTKESGVEVGGGSTPAAMVNTRNKQYPEGQQGFQ